MINNHSKKAYTILEIIFILIGIFVCVYIVNANPYLKDSISKLICSDKAQTENGEKKENNSPKLKDLNTYIARTRVAVADVFQALQLLRTTRETGVADFSSEGLKEYFQKAMQSQNISGNKIVTQNGMIFTFTGNGDCTKNDCYIQIDTNGEKGPNKVWTDPDTPSDIIILPVKNVNGTIQVAQPDIFQQF